MSEVEVSNEDMGLPADFDPQVLTASLLDKLSDDQINYVRNAALRRRNPALYERVMNVLRDQREEVVASMGRLPPVYVSPEIEFHPGLKVRFRTLFTAQTDDAMEASEDFIKAKRPSDLTASTYTQRAFLAHGIETYNGQPLGNRRLGNEFLDMWISENEAAKKTLVDFRKLRMNALAVMNDSVVMMLTQVSQIFQSFYDDIVNLRGTPDEVAIKTKKLVESVGNSTGPQVAGQPQT